MFDADVPSYAIDLEQAEPRRWSAVIDGEQAVAARLMAEAGAEFARIPELARWIFSHLYRLSGGLYHGEIEAWAEALRVSLGTATILNCAYELSHLRWPKPFGCTAGVRWVEGQGLVHVRTLDWPLTSMGPATRLFWFHRGGRRFVSVGFPGFVGVLSGMVPGAYSATINWAPPVAWPTFDFGATFLLRDVLETCDSYAAAMERLTNTRLSTSVFFTVCGIEPGQACVIERTQREAVVRGLNGPALTQANHHVADRFAKNNADLLDVLPGEEEFSIEGSGSRADTLAQRLAGIDAGCPLDDVARVLDVPTVLNPMTCQQMVFCSRRGEVRVWRRAT